MTIVHKNFTSKNTRINIRPIKSFELFKEKIASYVYVGVTVRLL